VPNVVIAPSLDYLEKAYDHAKYRRVSEHPYLEVRGAEVHVQYVPYGAETAGVARQVESMLDASVLRLETPADLEREQGWPGGQAWHAEPGLDQALWMRPVPALAGYRTPIAGLWLCGPAMHPGAAAPGAAGAIAAREVLRDAA